MIQAFFRGPPELEASRIFGVLMEYDFEWRTEQAGETRHPFLVPFMRENLLVGYLFSQKEKMTGPTIDRQYVLFWVDMMTKEMMLLEEYSDEGEKIIRVLNTSQEARDELCRMIETRMRQELVAIIEFARRNPTLNKLYGAE